MHWIYHQGLMDDDVFVSWYPEVNILVDGKDVNGISKIARKIICSESCHDYPEPSMSDGDLQDRFYLLYAKLLLSTFGNYTPTQKYFKYLCPGAIQPKHLPIQSNFSVKWGISKYNPKHTKGSVLFIENHLSNLRFAACGNKGQERLAVMELVNVYQIWVWILILIATVCLDKTLKRISTHLKVSPIFYVSKVWLEQGDPFPKKFTVSTVFRFIVGSTLLSGIVLSNAYKNSNVYNLVMPRKPVRFENLTELQSHGFSVYAPIATIRMMLLDSYENLSFEFFNDLHQKIIYKTPENQVFGDVETAIGSRRITDMERFEVLSKLPELHPKILDMVVPVAKALAVLYKASVLPETDQMNFVYGGPSLPVRHIMQKRQDKLIPRSLAQCNRTSWILPQYQIEKQLKQQQNSNFQTYFGQKVYDTVNLEFKMEGRPPVRTVWKLANLPASGIPGWFSKQFIVERSPEKPVPQKPNLKGNISVIFLLFLSGLALSGGKFLVEYGQKIYPLFIHLSVKWFCIATALAKNAFRNAKWYPCRLRFAPFKQIFSSRIIKLTRK